jgi:hypothetical protein
MVIKNHFSVTNYWLEKFFNIGHSLFFRYMHNGSEARFSDVNEWLNKLNLCLIDNKLFFKTNLTKSLDSYPKWMLQTKLNSILDHLEWQSYGEKEEKENPHIIFWPEK